MIVQKTNHIHDYRKVGFTREVGTTDPSTLLVHDVMPRMINRIILTRSCSCGRSQAFECGDKETMRTLFKSLKR